LGPHYSESDFPDPHALTTFERSKLDWSKPPLSPHTEILSLYRDLIALRKRQPCLRNCRKDLTEVRFDEAAKFLVMKRLDPSGSGSLLVFNSSENSQSIPVTVDPSGLRLTLWTGEAAYGGKSGSRPAEVLSGGAEVRLSAFEAAIYLK
jgi:maltooligosyltrehalose trehalohydrolase